MLKARLAASGSPAERDARPISEPRPHGEPAVIRPFARRLILRPTSRAHC
jgi:hypothetical protein